MQAHASRAGLPQLALALRRPGSHVQVLPPSVVLKIAASSTPAYAVSGSESEGSTCQTRLNSHGCCVPSYHVWRAGVAVINELIAFAFGEAARLV